MRRVNTSRYVLLLALSTLVPGIAESSACSTEAPVEPVVLCGTTVIVASQPSLLRVRVMDESEIAGPAYLPGMEPPQASPYMGVLIKEDGPGGRWAHEGSFNRENSGFFNDHRAGTFPRSPAGLHLVPPGEHTLYFITEPGVESVFELKLLDPGVGVRPGLVEIRPTRPAQLDWRTLPNVASGPPADSKVLYSAGTEFEYSPGQQAFAFFSTAMRGPAILTLDNTCHYDDRPDSPLPYWPGCPTVNDAGSFSIVWGPHLFGQGSRITVDQDGYVRYPGSTPSDHGVNAIGVWRTTVGENVHHSSLAWFLNLVI